MSDHDSAAKRVLPELIAFLGRIVNNTGPSVYFFDDGFPKQALFDDARKQRAALAAAQPKGDLSHIFAAEHPSEPKADERGSAEPFPYQRTFDAIAAATEIQGGHIAISVTDFRAAFGTAPARDGSEPGLREALIDLRLRYTTLFSLYAPYVYHPKGADPSSDLKLALATADKALSATPEQRAEPQGLTDAEIVAVLKSVPQEDYTKEGWIWKQRIAWARAILAAAPKAAAAPEGETSDTDEEAAAYQDGYQRGWEDRQRNGFDASAPPGWKRTPNGWERTGEEEPVAWRVRYRSEPGMIGHYPWSQTDRKPIRSLENPAYEVEPLYTHPAALEAQERDAARLLLEVVDQVAGELDADHRPSGAVIRTTLLPRMLAALSAGGRGGKG